MGRSPGIAFRQSHSIQIEELHHEWRYKRSSKSLSLNTGIKLKHLSLTTGERRDTTPIPLIVTHVRKNRTSLDYRNYSKGLQLKKTDNRTRKTVRSEDCLAKKSQLTYLML